VDHATDTAPADLYFSDEELTALALSVDPDEPLDPDAVPMSLYPEDLELLLPLSYMPPAMTRASRGWRVPVALLLVAAFLLIDAVGLCITYGTLVVA
jgi:hypothetical protein